MIPQYLILSLGVVLLGLSCEGRRLLTKSVTPEEDQDDDGGDDDETKGSVSLGSFESFAHQLAGDVTLIDQKTMEISGLSYDGLGPASWFLLGKTKRSTLPEFIELDGTVIPDENEQCETLKSYHKDEVTLKLPGNMKFSDYDYISMYCFRFNHNFGYVMIPKDLKLKNGTVAKDLKECDQDDLDNADDNRQRPGGGPRPRPPPPPPRGSGGSLLGGLIDSILG